MLSAVAIDSPVGRLTISATPEAIVSIAWTDDPQGEPTALLAEASRQLEAYFGRRLTRFDLPLLPAGLPFEQRVWHGMQQIPHGQTRTYGELAMEVGSAPRAIGRACGKNPIPIVIPCHRVLARDGLGGYSGGIGLDTKRRLLKLESADPQGLFLPLNAEQRRTAGAAAHPI